MRSLDPSHETSKITSFIKSSFQKAGFTNAVIALSGGIDSSVSFILTLQALGVDHVYPILLPYGPLNTQGTLDAMNVVDQLNIPLGHVTRIDIRPTVDAIIGRDPGVDNIRKGNVMARVRMVYVYDQAKKRNALVVGTENKSEHYLGYFTRFGDEASDIEPIRNYYKTQIFELGKFLNVPASILSKKPTAGLWEGQTDEGELGFSYADADAVLARMFDEGLPKEKIIASGIDPATIDKVLSFVQKNKFKHDLPIVAPEDEKETTQG